MTIDPKDYMLKLQGREYLPVAPRVVMFREDHKDWAIVTELIPPEKPTHVKAYVQDAGGNVIATAHKTIVSFKGGDVEKAETGAIGRALSLTGYGTIAAQDLDEGEQISDAPVENGRKAHRIADEDRPHPRDAKGWKPPTPEQAEAQMAEDDKAVSIREWAESIIERDVPDELGALKETILDIKAAPHRKNALRWYALAVAMTRGDLDVEQAAWCREQVLGLSDSVELKPVALDLLAPLVTGPA